MSRRTHSLPTGQTPPAADTVNIDTIIGHISAMASYSSDTNLANWLRTARTSTDIWADLAHNMSTHHNTPITRNQAKTALFAYISGRPAPSEHTHILAHRMFPDTNTTIQRIQRTHTLKDLWSLLAQHANTYHQLLVTKLAGNHPYTLHHITNTSSGVYNNSPHCREHLQQIITDHMNAAEHVGLGTYITLIR